MKFLSPLSVFRQAIKFYDPGSSLDFLNAAAKIGDPEERTFPRDLVQLGIKMHMRGLLNTLAVQTHRDWIWPYWIERQFNPLDPSFIPRSHVLSHINLSQRNWTILGSLDNPLRAIIDPRSLLTPWKDGWSLDFWFAIDEQLYTPGRFKNAKQRIHPKFPACKTARRR